MLSRNSRPSLVPVPDRKARRLLRQFRLEVLARHGLTELPTDVQLHLAAAANAGAAGDPGKASRELDAGHRQAAQAAKAPRRPAKRSAVPVQSVGAPQGPEAVAASLRARMGQPAAAAAPAVDPVTALKRRLGVA